MNVEAHLDNDHYGHNSDSSVVMMVVLIHTVMVNDLSLSLILTRGLQQCPRLQRHTPHVQQTGGQSQLGQDWAEQQ